MEKSGATFSELSSRSSLPTHSARDQKSLNNHTGPRIINFPRGRRGRASAIPPPLHLPPPFRPHHPDPHARRKVRNFNLASGRRVSSRSRFSLRLPRHPFNFAPVLTRAPKKSDAHCFAPEVPPDKPFSVHPRVWMRVRMRTAYGTNILNGLSLFYMSRF
ncbi:hypothetical protein GWI33_011050 [Rhynchophorus ferrugineus]|uniref:Uncharacterized protein n=1 Tax=Rhynchophorus ferrugineus TaxID=354439 RepID=A0A834I7K7_RHYFE|nr:hypothetical protein GWI33_011050 [Rhynchophorus ferrugineus]